MLLSDELETLTLLSLSMITKKLPMPPFLAATRGRHGAGIQFCSGLHDYVII